MESVGRRAVAEAIGTFALVLIGPGAAMVDAYSQGAIGHAGVALAFGFVVTAMIYTLGHVSGAHINPAVTLAFWSVGRFRSRDVLPYVLAQCAGAVAASLVLRWILGPVGHLGATLPGVGTGRSFVVEWLLSFILMFVIISVATDERVTAGFAGIAVGLTVGFEAMMGGPLTGASMNPARSLGPAVAGGGWDAHWIYWVAPITAMLVAVRVYDFLRPAGIVRHERETVPLGVEGPVSAAMG
ncbi:MAG TPA: MIP family channel protein [Longimicrobiaceae bacterium]|nr:MIP family channel protein [Longimicrobiaceae bacterium]